ncbi:MAG TPA: beta-ketoacyl-[acyl-carrier-protein] synthase II [Eubacterium sp.]|nr:beta-ketoacyl-[acyl-carrier-protein] synthase II [Eubacterium sp.]
MDRRVVITGMGVISPVGNDLRSFWESLKEGVCGIGKITRFDASDIAVSVDAEVKDFDASKYYASKPELRKTDLFMQYAMAASVEAMEDSGLNKENMEPERLGVYIGSGIGGIGTLLVETEKLREKGPEWVSPFLIPMMIGNMAAGSVAIRFGAKGPVLPVTTACATSTHSVGEAYRQIKHGYADAIITGGCEASINKLSMCGFINCKALSLSDDENSACVPFDARREGFVMGEGAAVLILEEYEHAKNRGAKIYAEVTGYANTSDAHHITAPDPTGASAARTMKLAMEEGGMSTEDAAKIYINAHGTGTHLNDLMETQGMKLLFAENASKLHISSTKSMTGHMLGATGAVEIIASAMALKNSLVPPTINYKEKDHECDLDYTPNRAVSCDVEYALSASYGFGGHNACVALKRYEE